VSTTSARRGQIASSLRDKEYRDFFVTEEIDTGIPFQIRAIRQARGWSQEELAARMGLTQASISRLENPDYGRFSLATLKRLASAFDVALAVRFVPFSRLVDWATNLSSEDLAVPDYEHDARLYPAPDPSLTAHHGVDITQGEDVCMVKITLLSDHRDHSNWFSNAEPDSLPMVR